MFVEEIKEVTPEVSEAFERLIPQLTLYSPPPTLSELEQMVRSDATVLLAARLQPGERIVGLMALVLARVPTGVRAWVEDVVVEEVCRGQGIGEGLMRASLERAHAAGAKVVELTSNPRREAANRLYQRLGFTQPQTNFYRYSFPLTGNKEKK